ncbi:MAG: hypothetical protein GY757_01210, partial [bacterium]|nr:hypothetical protein [bacterium]
MAVGKEKKKILKYGEGPNECFLPIAMGGDEDNLIIYDVPVQRHYIFDGEMKCKKRLKAKGLGMHWPPHGIGFSSKHNRMLMAFQDMLPNWGAELRIYLRELEGDGFDDNEIFKAKFYTRTPNGNFAIVGKRYYFDLIDDFVYILDKVEYRIKKIDMEGSTVKEIKVRNFPAKRFTMREREGCNKYGPVSKSIRFIYPEKLWPASGILKIADGLAVLRMEDYNLDEKEWAEADYFD